jgi:hypothetical protein
MFSVGQPSVTFAADAATTDTYADINGSSTSQGIIFAGICPAGSLNLTTGADTCECRKSGNCTLDDAMQVFVNVANFILGITGSCVLFVFVYGGWKWLLSRGDTKWIESGKAAMTGGVIGLIIIFGAYVAINFIVSGLITADGSEPGTTNLEDAITNTGASTTKVFTTE